MDRAADVGYVRVDHPAVVKISTYDFDRYGGLDGGIINLSLNFYTDQDGATYFRDIARTDKIISVISQTTY